MESSSGHQQRKEAEPLQDRQAQVAREAFGVRLPRVGDPVLRRMRGRNPPHYQGHRPWNASWLLISHLETMDLTGKRVLDVGCGWGLASIYCARQGAHVTSVDIDPHVFPFVDLLCDLNEVSADRVTASFDEVEDDRLAETDLLIGADICFRAAMTDSLFHLLARGRSRGLAHAAITDPGRIPYRDLAARCLAELEAEEGPLQTIEPLLPWPGNRPTISGRLLRITPR